MNYGHLISLSTTLSLRHIYSYIFLAGVTIAENIKTAHCSYNEIDITYKL